MTTLDAQPKTFAEFEAFRQELFASSRKMDITDPFTFAIERSNHDIIKLEELIRVAEVVEGRTIRSRIAGWKRQLQRRIEARDRLRQLAVEVMSSTNKPVPSKNRF